MITFDMLCQGIQEWFPGLDYKQFFGICLYLYDEIAAEDNKIIYIWFCKNNHQIFFS